MSILLTKKQKVYATLFVSHPPSAETLYNLMALCIRFFVYQNAIGPKTSCRGIPDILVSIQTDTPLSSMLNGMEHSFAGQKPLQRHTLLCLYAWWG